MTPLQLERYNRNIQVDVIGHDGQKRLLESRVLVVGAGGLGSAACFYLAAAGVGTLGVMDSDKVEVGNLQRQILHRTQSVGRPKVVSAQEQLVALNPDVEVLPIMERLTEDNVRETIKPYDVLVSALDNLKTRYILNDACVEARKPMVEAGVVRLEGLLLTIVPGKGPCYRCLFPEEPQPGAVPGTDKLGIVGAIAGIAGCLQALEVIKLVTGAGTPLVGRALLFDGQTSAFREIMIRRRLDCAICGSIT